MKRTIALALLWLIGLTAAAALRAADSAKVPKISPQEAARRVEEGKAVLIDVREPKEWAEGVAQPAQLLSLSDLRGERKDWKAFLEKNRGRELILYCRTGNRSGTAATILAKEGFTTTNAGGFAAWKEAGLPVRQP
jgi:rhodanese-related sulfurtransferase